MNTTDNKDAALKLAKEFGFEVKKSPRLGAIISFDEDGFVECYNAARKPLTQSLAKSMLMVASGDEKITDLQQQLLATQEAYQRVAGYAAHKSHCYVFDIFDIEKGCTCGLTEALANPPSLEAVERKKLEDEIAVLTDLKTSGSAIVANLLAMIAERKAKLEEMK